MKDADKQRFASIFELAEKMGQAAVDKAIAEGSWFWFPCGFAGVKSVGTTPFARWMREAGKSRKAYDGGVYINCNPTLEGPKVQSRELQEIYAKEFLRTLELNGITGVSTWGRDD